MIIMDTEDNSSENPAKGPEDGAMDDAVDDVVNDGYLTGQLLIAMPTMGDPRFERTVIYMCAHSADGAMGLVVNKEANEIDFLELLNQLEIETDGVKNPIPVLTGGPVETGRGFVLHSMDYSQGSTLKVTDEVGLTATVDILRAIAEGEGPDRSLLTLGYAGWASGQLDDEIQANGWLMVPADEDLVFGEDIGSKWHQAINKIGIDLSKLATESGTA